MRPAITQEPLHRPDNEPDFYRYPALDGDYADQKTEDIEGARGEDGASLASAKLLLEALLPSSVAGGAVTSAPNLQAPSEAAALISAQLYQLLAAPLGGGAPAAATTPVAASRNDLLLRHQQMHASNMHHLAEARDVADSNSGGGGFAGASGLGALTSYYRPPSSSGIVSAKLSSAATRANIATISALVAPIAPLLPILGADKGKSDAGAKTKKTKGSTSKDKKPKKKPRKKWLPPLGPPAQPSSNVAAGSITAAEKIQYAATVSNPNSSSSSSSSSSDEHKYDWLFTNAEVFASLAETTSGRQQHH